MAQGIVKNAVKQGMKVYIVASEGARTSFAALAENWGDLVAEVNAEREHREQPDESTATEPGKTRRSRKSRAMSKAIGGDQPEAQAV